MRLVTIPFSHFCEKARWALEYADLAFVEEGHPPLLHYRATTLRRAGKSVPVLVADGCVYADSKDIVAFADASLPEERKLYPRDLDEAREVRELEADFGRVLGPAIRRFAYVHVLADPAIRRRYFRTEITRLDAFLIPWLEPWVIAAIRRGLRLTPEGAARSLRRIQETFRTIDERLADGRSYLVGSRFSAADLTFAALASPVLQPPELPPPRMSLDEAPAALREVSEALRKSASGRHALRMYALHRNRPPHPAREESRFESRPL